MSDRVTHHAIAARIRSLKEFQRETSISTIASAASWSVCTHTQGREREALCSYLVMHELLERVRAKMSPICQLELNPNRVLEKQVQPAPAADNLNVLSILRMRSGPHILGFLATVVRCQTIMGRYKLLLGLRVGRCLGILIRAYDAAHSFQT